LNMKIRVAVVLLIAMFAFQGVFAQTITREEMMFLTSEWKGERFPDGRPKIPDELLVRAKKNND